MMRELKADMARYRSYERSWGRVLSNTAFWGVACYRLGRYAYYQNPPTVIAPLIKATYQVINKVLEATTEMFLDPQAEIGEGLYIGHSGGIHINNEAKIGKNCSIAHQVTIGTSAGGRPGAPVLGDDVYVGTGAKIIGKIKIGEGAKIAANSLVMSNVPARSTVMGVPARPVMRDMGTDPK